MPDDAVDPAFAEAPVSTRPHVAARVEDRLFAALGKRLRRRRWEARVEGNTGYGTPTWVRVLARAVLTPREGVLPPAWDRRGWRSFVAVPAAGEVVRVAVGGVHQVVVADRAGYVDLRVELPEPLAPGWHTVRLTPTSGVAVDAPVLVVGDAVLGVVSDIDDTVMDTRLPRPLIAAWNTFVLHPRARRAVPGMPELYRAIQERYPDAPFVYLSTGAWNTAATLRRFLDVNGYPAGPILLTDWGPTHTGWFRSGIGHKNGQLDRVFAELPGVRWILVGDDGQHDPRVYDAVVRRHPERVVAVAIRQLTPAQQVLSHGLPVPLPTTEGGHLLHVHGLLGGSHRGSAPGSPGSPAGTLGARSSGAAAVPRQVPVVRGADGFVLRAGLLGGAQHGGAQHDGARRE